ncbi:MAG: SpoIIE family protein phosphatase [Acidobacteria bacterium]|nr:SpoIIE family protein phosphatase [Acidobacteriota bacterium]
MPQPVQLSPSEVSINPWSSIASQLRFGLVVIVALTLLVTGSLLIYSSFQTLIQETNSLQRERSRVAAETIDAYLDDLLRKLNYLARVRGLTDLPAETKQTMLEGLARHNQAYELIAVLDREGNVQSSVNPYGGAKPGPMRNSSLFIRTFFKHEDFVADVTIDPDLNQPVTTFAVPIRNAQDSVDGVLLARINLKFLNFVTSQTEVGRTGYTYVVDARNRLISRKGTTGQTVQLEDGSRLAFLQDLTITKARSLAVYHGLYGAEVLGAVAPVRNLNWLVVVELPTAEAYAPVRRQIFTMGLSLLVVVIGATGVGFLFAQRVVVPFQRLTSAAQRIRDGNLEVQVHIPDRNELGVLGQAFNTMAAQLQASFQALEQINEDLEARVASRTAELQAAFQEIETLNQQLKAENLRMGAELEVTRQLQQMLLPREAELQNIADLDIAGFMAPADEVGGDYYDVLQHNGRIKIGIGDVTGHGLESGVVMMMAQTAVRTLLANDETDPVKCMNTINRVIYENTRRMRSARNMTFALLEYEAGVFRLSGQHEDVLVLRTSGQIERIDTFELGFPLGIEPDISQFVAQIDIELAGGEVLVMYTDGITEAVNPDQEQYGIDRLCAVLTAHRGASATDLQHRVVEDVKAFIGSQKIFDDLTLLVIKKKPFPPHASPP